jgi:CheY-like chemotaxis protein
LAEDGAMSAASQRVLVIDDDAAVREAFRLALDGLPYEVLEAADGEQGAAIAGNLQFDLAFVDLRMPGIDGVETLRRLRSARPAVPVYIVTAYRRDYFDDLVTARSEGLAFELLRKPLERAQIIAVTRAALAEPDAAGDEP